MHGLRCLKKKKITKLFQIKNASLSQYIDFLVFYSIHITVTALSLTKVRMLRIRDRYTRNGIIFEVQRASLCLFLSGYWKSLRTKYVFVQWRCLPQTTEKVFFFKLTPTLQMKYIGENIGTTISDVSESIFPFVRQTQLVAVAPILSNAYHKSID